MGWIIFIILIVAICWTTFGRNIFINLSQRKENSFEIEQPLDRETLMEILRTKVQYPDAKEIFYNENGEITVHCKYAQHIVRCNEKRVHVIKDWPEVKKPQGVFQWILFILLLKEEADTFQAKCIEEADCLYAYILKAFYPDAPINAPIEKATMDRHYRTRKFVIIGLCGALIALLIVSLINTGIIGDKSKGIKNSYLSEYSSTETIGEVFEDYFSNIKWENYKQGAQEMVDFKGDFSYMGEPTTMIITFIVEKDYFLISEIKINGEVISEFWIPIIIEHIYSN